MATMKDVARRAGVSIATVSATISGSAYVSPELKARVQAAIEELGYARNSMASGLKRGTSSLIGLIVPDITNPFFTEFVHSIQRRAREVGLTVLLGCSDDDEAREIDLLKLMRSHQAAGTIICPTGGDEACRRLAALRDRMHLVAVDNAPDDMGVDTVVLDNRKAVDMAVTHILSFGHERVATVSGPPSRFVSRERHDGFLDVMARNGIDVLPAHVRRGGFHVEQALAAGHELLAGGDRPTAIFVANNHMLIGIMQAVADMELSVPHDISIAGIDDFPWARAVVPALTTVRQPVDAMAEAALTRLQARIEGDGEAPQRIILDPELMVRRSCAAPAREMA